MKKVHLSYLSITVLISTVVTIGLSLMYPNAPQLVISMSTLVTVVSGIATLLILENKDGFLKSLRGTGLEFLEPIIGLGAACFLISGIIVPLAWFEIIHFISISTTVFILYVITVSCTAFFFFPGKKKESVDHIKQTQTY